MQMISRPALSLLVGSFALVLAAVPAPGQTKDSSAVDCRRALELLESGNALEAAKALQVAKKNAKNDIEAWHCLGVGYERIGKSNDARKAHEKAGKLGRAMIAAQLEISISYDFPALLSKLKPELSLAAASTDEYLRLNPTLSKSKRQQWQELADLLHDYETFPNISGLTIYKGKEVTTKARVLSKPEPTYTEEARKNSVTGTVVLRCVFAEDGKVRAIMPLVRLPLGLTMRAIVAARQIRFTPATKDGKPVSMWMQLEYNFNLY